MDESIDVADLAVLLVFVRYQYDHAIEEDVLICKSLESNTTRAESFNVVNNYFYENGLPYDCINVCTDGAKVMVRKLQTKIKEIAKNSTSFVCLLKFCFLCTLKNLVLQVCTSLPLTFR
ncbi:hypothetical protein RN001_007632 [Aquatica leii]|uniref:DUF4371 domain-containing protein n=1 Tax=Aquatica leii TaxID=1421715 RepID=A0AAN7PDD8_9COLE|nr:hypothetical protein RN001_007632 [Aquatica leii]